MANENNTAQNAASTDAKKDVWPHRFGTLETIDMRHGNKGRYVILTVQGKAKKYTAFAFQDDVIEKVLAAGEGARVWFKGPMEPVQRTHESGGKYTERQMKVVYFKDKTVREDAPEAAAEEQQASEETASTMTNDQVDDEIPF